MSLAANNSHDHVAFLIDMARDNTPSGRSQLVSSVADLYLSTDEQIGVRERALVTEILADLLPRSDVAIRRDLALRLAEEPNIPVELIILLANDKLSDIAAPILKRSTLLDDNALIGVIRTNGTDHHLAIAERLVLSEMLADALIDIGDHEVATAVVNNKGAYLSPSTMQKLNVMARVHWPLCRPLVTRPEFGTEMATQIYWWLSDDLRISVTERFPKVLGELNRALELAVQDFVDAARTSREVNPEQEMLADRLAQCGAINAQMLIHLLRRGQSKLFQMLFARLTKLSPDAVHIMVAQPGGETLTIACRAMNIEKGNFASLFLLSRGARPGDQVVDPRELSRVLALYDRLTSDAAKTMLTSWQRDTKQLLAMIERQG